MLETARRAVGLGKGVLGAIKLARGASHHEVVWRSGPCRLLRYTPEQTAPTATPLLLVTPIINRFRIVDLTGEGSLVAGLTAAGIPVYVMDWGAPRRIDAGTDWEDYVLRYLPRALGAAGLPQVDVLGYCLGGTISVLFAARFPERVRRLVTLNAPVRFLDAPHMDLLRRWVQPQAFPVDRLTRACGNMPGAMVLSGFLWQKPLSAALKYYYAWPKMSDGAFSGGFWALESWNSDTVDIPGAAYRRLIVDLYREDKLARGEFTLRGEAVDLSRITCPVLVVASARDTTCPPAAALALLELVGSKRAESLELPGGHVGGVVGSRASAQLHRPLVEWLRS